MYSMKEPTDAERAAFLARMAAQLPTLQMLFDAARALCRRYDHNAAILRLNLDLTTAERRSTEEAERLWDQAKRAAAQPHARYATGGRIRIFGT